MALSEELTLAWGSLSGHSPHSGWRTIPISSTGPCRLRAGRSFPDNSQALLVGFSPQILKAVGKVPEGHGFALQSIDLPGEQHRWLALTRKPDGKSELFLTLSCDVATLLTSSPSIGEPQLLQLFLERVKAWQEFMRKDAQLLSPEAELGLAGELALLTAMLSYLEPADALTTWVGPLDGLQDFEIGAGAIEVKSTLAPVGFPARIMSLEQLDDAVRKPIFVCGMRFGLSEAGKTLAEIVSDIRLRIGPLGAAAELFSTRLLAAGLLGNNEVEFERRFQVLETFLLEVSSEFPRLTSGNVPRGVTRAMYGIDLSQAPGRRVDLSEALKILGAI